MKSEHKNNTKDVATEALESSVGINLALIVRA